MSELLPFSIKLIDWNAGSNPLKAIRIAVFVEEQGVPEDLEWDGQDERSRHVVAVASSGTPIGTGRLLPDAHIGRLAVLKEWRGQGVGGALLDTLLVLANRTGFGAVQLHAQTHALDFYRKRGFIAQGEEFMEAGIPHFLMTRSTADQTSWPAAFAARSPARMS